MDDLKYKLLEAIRAELRARLERLNRAANEAHAAATDPGSKAESKYDTRNLEASYLAVGQAKQAAEIVESVRVFDHLTLPNFARGSAVDAGALVETEMRGQKAFFLLVPSCGGMEVAADGVMATLLTPESVLYRSLLEQHVGDFIPGPDLKISSVC